MKKISLPLLIVMIFFITSPYAAPFTPNSSQYVVAESSVKSQEKYYVNLGVLKETYQHNSNDLDAAIAIANAYLIIARKSGDSRYFGLAESAIKPWWDRNSNQQLNLIKATILQFSHRFEESNTILSHALNFNPRNAQALLLRANNLMTMGEFQLASKDCGSLALSATPSVSAACFFAIKGLQINSDDMLLLVAELSEMVNQDTGLNEDVNLWVSSIIVEVLINHNQFAMAESYVEFISSKYKLNNELLLLYADILLRQGQFDKVQELLNTSAASVDAQLKLLIARKQQQPDNVGVEYSDIKKRFELDAFRGEMHFRERAIFELVINENFVKAFESARNNWQFQRSMKDASLLFICAEKVNNEETMNEIQRWRWSNKIKVEFSQRIF